MKDADFAEMVALIFEYGTTEMDQFDHLRIGPLYVSISLELPPDHPESAYRALTP